MPPGQVVCVVNADQLVMVLTDEISVTVKMNSTCTAGYSDDTVLDFSS